MGPEGGISPVRGYPSRAYQKTRFSTFTEMIKPEIIFDVIGNPKGDPRIRAGFSKRTNRSFVYGNPSADLWKSKIRAAGVLAADRAHFGEPIPLGIPIGVDLFFRFARPQSHFHDGARRLRLRASAPIFHSGRPDRDNCDKAILDPLSASKTRSALFWSDDGQAAVGMLQKRYVQPGELPGVTIRIYPLTETAMAQSYKGPPSLPPEDRILPPPIELRPNEALMLQRIRAGLTISDVCGLFGVSERIFRTWESGKRSRHHPLRVQPGLDPPPTPSEWCLLQRLRSGANRRQLSSLSRLDPAWIRLVEEQPFGGDLDPSALVHWWKTVHKEEHKLEQRKKRKPRRNRKAWHA